MAAKAAGYIVTMVPPESYFDPYVYASVPTLLPFLPIILYIGCVEF